MFDSINLGMSTSGKPFDAGILAESLIFYRKVCLIASSSTLGVLFKLIPPLQVLRLMQQGVLEIHFSESAKAVFSTNPYPGIQKYSLGAFSFPGGDLETQATAAVRQAMGKTGQSRVAASQFCKLIRPSDQNTFNDYLFLNELKVAEIVVPEVSALVRKLAPNYTQSEPIKFSIEGQSSGFIVKTNLVFDAINSEYHKMVSPAHSTVTEAYILALIQKARESAYLAAKLGSELVADPVESCILESHLDEVIAARSRSENEIDSFAHLILDAGKPIREMINSGRVDFAEVLKVVERSAKFREWASGQATDANLVTALYQKTIQDTWIEKLPSKSVRFALFTGGGIALDALVGSGGIATVASVGLGAFDNFLVDKLVGGWKPHHFVEQDLAPVFRKSGK